MLSLLPLFSSDIHDVHTSPHQTVFLPLWSVSLYPDIPSCHGFSPDDHRSFPALSWQFPDLSHRQTDKFFSQTP